MKFLREHLLGLYEWETVIKQSLLDGEAKATRRLFNPLDGNQVLFIINVFLMTINNPSVENGRRVEWLLLEKLPLDSKSEISVLHWLLKQEPSAVCS